MVVVTMAITMVMLIHNLGYSDSGSWFHVNENYHLWVIIIICYYDAMTFCYCYYLRLPFSICSFHLPLFVVASGYFAVVTVVSTLYSFGNYHIKHACSISNVM